MKIINELKVPDILLNQSSLRTTEEEDANVKQLVNKPSTRKV